jgi:hypothetical protein
MRRIVFSFLVGLLLVPVWVGQAHAQLVADHTVVAQFEQIPDSALQTAAAIRLMFRHASVGGTVDNALDCLQGTRANPIECTLYPDYKYDRRNWSFQARGNSGWYGKVDDFVAETQNQLSGFDVFSFKFCYLEGLDQLAEPCGNPFDPAEVDQAWEYLRSNMETLETTYPGKTFIWWTIPLTQPGQFCTETLNARIRSYAAANGKILFDIADIESHDIAGAHYTNADGWEVAYAPHCGEAPPGPACHPNWTGSIMLAKAFWWMMARIAGWEGGLGRISDMKLTRSGSDIAFYWTPDSMAQGGYHFYQTNTREDASSMRDDYLGYDPFASAGPSATMPFLYSNGIADGFLYYQVLGVGSDGITEGPN